MLLAIMSSTIESEPTVAEPAPSGIEHTGVIDLLTQDAQTGLVTLGMVERRPWDGSKKQRYELQEKINAYLSFALDGEMAEAYPNLVGKPLQIRLDCVEAPDTETTHFLDYVRQQISFQGIALKLQLIGQPQGGGCGSGGCGCSCQ
jgi:hypothetical protein